MPDIEYNCPACGTLASVSARAAGKSLPCPSCGRRSIIPHVAQSNPDLAFAAPQGRPLGSEPWYYGFAVFYAVGVMVLGILGFGIALTFLFVAACLSNERALFTWSTFYLFFLLLGVVFACAITLLFVDLGRNIRAIRQQTRR